MLSADDPGEEPTLATVLQPLLKWLRTNIAVLPLGDGDDALEELAPALRMRAEMARAAAGLNCTSNAIRAEVESALPARHLRNVCAQAEAMADVARRLLQLGSMRADAALRARLVALCAADAVAWPEDDTDATAAERWAALAAQVEDFLEGSVEAREEMLQAREDAGEVITPKERLLLAALRCGRDAQLVAAMGIDDADIEAPESPVQLMLRMLPTPKAEAA